MEFRVDKADSRKTSNGAEQDLLAQVAQGDKVAFREIYYLFAAELDRYVFLYTRSREDTEEILQDIFVKLWEKRQLLPGIASFRGYLFRMARNHVLNYFRGARIRLRTEAFPERDEQVAYQMDAADQLLYKQYYKLALQAIELLPHRRKEVFLLKLEKDLSQQEIACELGVSKSAVKQHLYGATRFIREYLHRHGVFAAFLSFTFLS